MDMLTPRVVTLGVSCVTVTSQAPLRSVCVYSLPSSNGLANGDVLKYNVHESDLDRRRADTGGSSWGFRKMSTGKTKTSK